MKIIYLVFVVFLISCSEKNNLEIFFNEKSSFSAFENRFQQGYRAPYGKLEGLKKILKKNELVVGDLDLTPDISGYFYSYNEKQKYKTEFYVFVLMYSETPSKTYEVVSLYFDEKGDLIWRNCTTKEFVCSKESVPEGRGWFYDI